MSQSKRATSPNKKKAPAPGRAAETSTRKGVSAKSRGRGGVLDTIGDPDRTPDIGIARPSRIGRNTI